MKWPTSIRTTLDKTGISFSQNIRRSTTPFFPFPCLPNFSYWAYIAAREFWIREKTNDPWIVVLHRRRSHQPHSPCESWNPTNSHQVSSCKVFSSPLDMVWIFRNVSDRQSQNDVPITTSVHEIFRSDLALDVWYPFHDHYYFHIVFERRKILPIYIPIRYHNLVWGDYSI